MYEFQDLIWEYYRHHGRDLPWRETHDPYAIVTSEIMLQQTQVSRVMTMYPFWMSRFPDWRSLAEAPTADVLAVWQGMGYNRRALWLVGIARTVVNELGGKLPELPDELEKLPGIGRNTAGSIAAFAFDYPGVFIETNIRRVFIHHFFDDAREVNDKQLMPIIEQALDREQPREWYYALMDYGSWLATQTPNPNRRSKHYAVQSKFEGSRRQVRGEILRRALVGVVTESDLFALDSRANSVAEDLMKEGFLKRGPRGYST